jgi:EAL domain-containing protein (putative c-di-GMP-specific phosphodiesterase class I)
MQTLPIAETNPTVAWLESTPRDGHESLRAELVQLPFTIGRNEACDLTIESSRVSREHVRIDASSGNYTIQDLGSTNGTFVNGVKIKESALADGDLVTVANFGLIFHLPQDSPRAAATHAFTSCNDSPPESPFRLIETVRALQEVSLHRAARNHLQAIVALGDGAAMGYEIGPRTFDDTAAVRAESRLPAGFNCHAMLRASELSRTLAVEQTWNVFGDVLMFLPARLAELGTVALFDSLERLKQRPTGEARLVVQAPLEAISDPEVFGDLHGQLQEIGVAVAIDGFQGKRAQLEALRECAPDYIKLSGSIVRTLSSSAEQRQSLQLLLAAARDLSVQVIGCGVTTDADWQACKSNGIGLAQGAFVAAAMPLDTCSNSKR